MSSSFSRGDAKRDDMSCDDASLTDAILWSDCPEDLYLQRMLQEQREAKQDAENKGRTLEQVFTQSPSRPPKQSSASKVRDWSPMASSVVTDDDSDEPPKEEVTEPEPEEQGSDVDEEAPPPPPDARSPPATPPRSPIPPDTFKDEECDYSIATNSSYGDELMEALGSNYDDGMAVSTITPDTLTRAIEPLEDEEKEDPGWWVKAEQVPDASLVQDASKPIQKAKGKNGGYQSPNRTKKAEVPLSPNTQSTKRTFADPESEDSGTDSSEDKKAFCAGCAKRASDDPFCRMLVKVAVGFFILFIALGIAAAVVSTGRDKNKSMEEISSPTLAPTMVDLQPHDGPTPPPKETLFPTASPVGTTAPTAATTVGSPAPTTVFEEYIVGIILGASPSSYEMLNDKNSPQARSKEWILKDDFILSMDDQDPRRILQRWVLGVLYYSTSGDTTWKNDKGWLTPDSECYWHTFADSETCDEENNFKRLDLRANSLEGTIPSELALLSDNLGRIYLNSNNLVGTLPTELGDCTNLLRFFVTVNGITGTIPTEFGRATTLEAFGVGRNQMTGTLPAEISKLTNLEILDLSTNLLKGTMPASYGDLGQLEFLSLVHNNFTGTLPCAIGSMDRFGGLKLEYECEEMSCPCCGICKDV